MYIYIHIWQFAFILVSEQETSHPSAPPVRPPVRPQAPPQCARESAAAVRPPVRPPVLPPCPPRVTPVRPPVRPPGCLLSSTVCLCRKTKADRNAKTECGTQPCQDQCAPPVRPSFRKRRGALAKKVAKIKGPEADGSALGGALDPNKCKLPYIYIYIYNIILYYR